MDLTQIRQLSFSIDEFGIMKCTVGRQKKRMAWEFCHPSKKKPPYLIANNLFKLDFISHVKGENFCFKDEFIFSLQ